MSHSDEFSDTFQADLFETDSSRRLLDQLLIDSKLYTSSRDYKELLDFVVRLNNFAPFNAMLLQVQKPGLSYAASAKDWYEIYGRTVIKGARPLLILWPFGPVALVYDVVVTEGDELPEDVSPFIAEGAITLQQINEFQTLLRKKGIFLYWMDRGENSAGSMSIEKSSGNNNEIRAYRLELNKNHPAPVQFATLAHELGHLFLGHLGKDKKLNAPVRQALSERQRELEAESVSYIVCKRNGVESKSKTYLSGIVEKDINTDELDIYQIMRAAGHVETILKLTGHVKFDMSVKC